MTGQSRLLTKRAHGGGGSDHSSAGATGRAPPLPVSSTNGPSSCAWAKGKLQLSKTKTPRRNFPGSPGRLLGPHPLHGVPRADSQGLGGATGHGPEQSCCHPGR